MNTNMVIAKLDKTETVPEDEIDLLDIFLRLWKHKFLIILLVLLTTASAYLYLFITSKSYTDSLVRLEFSGIDFWVGGFGNFKDKGQLLYLTPLLTRPDPGMQTIMGPGIRKNTLK